jgi:hypothetical protein
VSDLQRGYLPDGKDRQHPVKDPDDREQVSAPALWRNPGIRTWYSTVNYPNVPTGPVIDVR